MKTPDLELKEREMLELVAQGANTRGIAKKMGYTEGTVRVYLHNLYRKLGVKNRTEALLWQLEHARAMEHPAVAVRSSAARAEESFGDVAVREGLLSTLGIMESFIGPYGRLWEVGARLKNVPLDKGALGRRDEARTLWRALLQGVVTYAKGLHDEGLGAHLVDEAPSEAVLLVALLILGGYSNAADGYINQFSKARKGGRAITGRELNLLRSLRQAVYASDEEPLVAIYQLATEKAANPILRQVASVVLFHAYKLRKDLPRARETANALWAEAEGGRRQLEAMGVRPLDRQAVLPKPARMPSRQAVREKVTAGG